MGTVYKLYLDKGRPGLQLMNQSGRYVQCVRPCCMYKVFRAQWSVKTPDTFA
jgi:hypothetical protein